MIIYFGLSADCLSQCSPHLIEERLSSLLHSHRNGHNLVVIKRTTAEWCRKNVSLSNVDQAMLHQLETESTQSASLRQRARYFMEIAPAGSKFLRTVPSTISLPLDYQFFDSVVLCPIVVVEDALNDGAVIEALIRVAVGSLSPIERLKEGAAHGGGERLFDFALKKIKDGRMVWVVVDSDKKTPFSSAKSTRRIELLISQASSPVLFNHVIPCHEIENVIDLDTWSSVRPIRIHPTFQILKEIYLKERLEGADPREAFQLFFDMKNGFTHETLEKAESVEARSWLTHRLSMVGVSVDGFTIQGFGSSLMRQLLRSETIFDDLALMCSRQPWADIFAELLQDARWIFLSPAPRRT